MSLFLYEDVPLRTTRKLGDYTEDKPIPWRFGDLTASRFDLIRLTDTRFVAADHAMQVTEVFVAELKTISFDVSLESDGAGNTWTIVTLGAPAPAGSSVSARGRGMLDPSTGALIENPGDVLARISAMCGRSDDFSGLRGEAAAAGLRVAGSIETPQSIRAQFDEIAQSVGAIWAPGMSRLYPTAIVSAPVFQIDRTRAGGVTVAADIVDTADVLRLGYDVSASTGRAERFIELEATPNQYGGLVKDVTFSWLRGAANAESVGRRLLERYAGERYDVTFDAGRADLRPGNWSRLVDLPDWPIPGADPDVMLLAVDVTPGASDSQCVGETILSRPSIRVSGYSVALPDTSEGGVEVTVQDGVAIITVFDPAGKPFQGARVSLDGSAAKTTDVVGQVQFPVTPGKHTLVISAAGFDDQTLVIET